MPVSGETESLVRALVHAASLETLAQIDVDSLFPGHHEISLTRGGRHLIAARDVVARGLLPRSTT